MQIKTTGIEGLLELSPVTYPDDRGWFLEFYKEEAFKDLGIASPFVQDNLSFSKKNVVRGLHFQVAPHGQAKLVTVLSGKVMDVVVDLRKDSPTFGQVYYCLLDSERHNYLYVPEGLAHGFIALEDSLFFYKCTSPYHRSAERGINCFDPDLNIQWQVNNPIVSEKDRQLPNLREYLEKSVNSPL